MKDDGPSGDFMKDVAEKLEGIAPEIRAAADRKIADRYRKFREDVIALRTTEPDAANPATRHKFMALAEEFKSDTSIAMKEAHELQLKQMEVARDGPRAAVAATDAQIERWERQARHALYERHELTGAQMAERHSLESSKSPGANLGQKHLNEIAAFQTRKHKDHEALEIQIARARISRIIPDRNHAPVHSAGEIDRWAETAREYQDRRHHLEAKPLVAPFLIEPGLAWDKSRADVLLKRQEAEGKQLEDTIRNAYETGRIPGMEPPGIENAPRMER